MCCEQRRHCERGPGGCACAPMQPPGSAAFLECVGRDGAGAAQQGLCVWGDDWGGRTVRCACAVRKVGYFGPVFPDGQGDRSNDCVPMHGTAQILTQSKNSDDELNKLDFPLKMPDCGLNLLLLPSGRSLPGSWVVFRVATGTLRDSWVPRAPCPRCAAPPPGAVVGGASAGRGMAGCGTHRRGARQHPCAPWPGCTFVSQVGGFRVSSKPQPAAADAAPKVQPAPDHPPATSGRCACGDWAIAECS